METWKNTFCFLFVLATVITGEEVTITTPHVTHDPQGKCLLPDVLVIELLRSGQEMTWSIKLNRDDVIPSVRSVLLMTDTPSRSIETFQVVSNQEGSLFHGNQKYRVTQSSSQRQHTEVFPSYVTAIYRMEEISELKAGDTTVIGSPKTNTARSHYSSRYKRAVTLPATYNIDILPVVDSTLYNKFYSSSNGNTNLTMSNIVDYLGNLFTAVAMRFDTLALETRTLKIRMITPLLLTIPSQSPYTTSDLEPDGGEYKINAITLLERFANWLRGYKNLVPNDHAMFFTALNIYGGSDSGIKFNITKGLAYVGTMCKAGGNSSSVVEDKGAYQSEGVAAHELGHCLGSRHDGENNVCFSADRYIMSDSSYPETDSNALHPWRFSSCSSTYVLSLLESLETNNALLQGCLINATGSIEVGDYTVSADVQCQLFYGELSYVCRNSSKASLEDLCDEFYCSIPGTSMCERMIAATGTCCGYQKKCYQGQCVDAAQGQCNINQICPFGDQKGVVLDGKTCADLPSTFCYDNAVYLRCCKTCEKYKTDRQGCTYGDKQLNCNANECGSTFTSGDFQSLAYNFVCCSTCKSDCTDAENLWLSSGTYTCNDYIFNLGNKNVCYQISGNKKIYEYACCKSCEAARDTTNTACPWGNVKTIACAALQSKSPGYICKETELQSCCRTCGLLSSGVSTSTALIPSTITSPTNTPTTTSTTNTPTTTTSTIKKPATIISTPTEPTTSTSTSTPKIIVPTVEECDKKRCSIVMPQ